MLLFKSSLLSNCMHSQKMRHTAWRGPFLLSPMAVRITSANLKGRHWSDDMSASLIARIYAEHVRWNRETLPLHIIRDFQLLNFQDLWDVELSNCRFQAWFQRRMKQQFVQNVATLSGEEVPHVCQRKHKHVGTKTAAAAPALGTPEL